MTGSRRSGACHRFLLLLATVTACLGPWSRSASADAPATTPAPSTWQAYQRDYHFQRLDDRSGLTQNSVSPIFQDHVGFLWFATQGGLFRYDGCTLTRFRHDPDRRDSLPGGYRATALADAGQGLIWASATSGGSTIDSATGVIHSFHETPGNPDSLAGRMVTSLPVDRAGRVWAGTLSVWNRLLHQDGSTVTFQRHGLRSGLPGPTIDCILEDARSRIWVSTNPGLAELNRETGGVRSFGVADGTQGDEYNGGAYPRADRDRLPFGGHGFDIVDAAWNDLRPGNYRLEVQSLQRDVSPGGSAALRVHVPTAWWWSGPMRIVYATTLALLVLILLLGWRSHYLDQARHRRQLRLRESRLRQALWGSGDEFWDWNLATGTILRLGPEGAPGGHHEESVSADEWRTRMLHPDDVAAFNRALAEHVSGNAEHFEVEHRVRNRNGDWTWVISRGRIVERDASGAALRICGTERDISARRAADRDRRIASEVIRNMSEAVAVTDLDFHFVSVNTAFTRMTGYADREVLGHDAAVLNGSRHSPDSYSQVRRTLVETGHWRGELWQRRKDGEEFLCWVELNEVCDATGQRTHMIAVLTDITDRKRAEQELRYLANYDTLTGLPNRALLGERLGGAVINARRSGQKVGLLFLDLDRFKHINDSLGHFAGDRTLKATGARLRQCVRETDVVARLGGDEFTVVLDNLADVRGAEDMAQRLIRAFARPLQLSTTQEVVISPSIGIAVYPEHGETPADLLKCADTAMYQAKERGRNTWTVYHAGMDTRARDHATLVTALRRALARHELRMVYQPKLDIRGGRGITGMEALLRWHHPQLGEVPPSTFIPLAEETGQIHDLSAFVFATACADLRRFRDHGHRNLTMAINLSAAQLNRPDLTPHICEMLAEHGIAPSQIELELTESMVMANAEHSVRLLGELKAIGTRLAIDDFGTGYSSLAYLKRLPIDTLKIDQEFVGDITTDPDDAAITSTIITLAHSLQLRVVAEGVETEAQLAFLRTQGCDEIQGYWFARPLSADACLAFLDRHAATAARPARPA